MKSTEQAKRIYELCVPMAEAKKKLIYEEVTRELGYLRAVSGHPIKCGLELLLVACVRRGLPKLSDIVTSKSTGTPAYKRRDGDLPWEEEIKRVFEFEEWPTADDFDWGYIWNNRKELSDKFGTPGYWSRSPVFSPPSSKIA